MNRILILYAHPSPHRSEVNQPLFDACQNQEGVTCVDLYGEYPTFNIDICREQRRLIDHDVVIFMYPLYWYSTPSLLKEWQDLVLEYDFAYGHEGKALQDKLFFCTITAGGAEKSYSHSSYNHFTIRELLQPLEQMANITRMHYLPPYTLFGARTAVEEQRLDEHIAGFVQLLSLIREQGISYQDTSDYVTMNQFLLERGLLSISSDPGPDSGGNPTSGAGSSSTSVASSDMTSSPISQEGKL